MIYNCLSILVLLEQDQTIEVDKKVEGIALIDGYINLYNTCSYVHSESSLTIHEEKTNKITTMSEFLCVIRFILT